MKYSHNVLSFSTQTASQTLGDGVVVWGKIQKTQLAPFTRTLKSVYGAIDTITEERASLTEIMKTHPELLGSQRIEELLQAVRINTDGLLMNEIVSIQMITDITARRRNIIVYCDPEQGDSILIESIDRPIQSNKNHLKKVVG